MERAKRRRRDEGTEIAVLTLPCSSGSPLSFFFLLFFGKACGIVWVGGSFVAVGRKQTSARSFGVWRNKRKQKNAIDAQTLVRDTMMKFSISASEQRPLPFGSAYVKYCWGEKLGTWVHVMDC